MSAHQKTLLSCFSRGDPSATLETANAIAVAVPSVNVPSMVRCGFVLHLSLLSEKASASIWEFDASGRRPIANRRLKGLVGSRRLQ